MIPGRMFGPYITRDIYSTHNSFYCYESTFEIEAVKPEDIGTVYVFVSNEKGHAGAQIHIQLAKTPGIGEQNSLGKSLLINLLACARNYARRLLSREFLTNATTTASRLHQQQQQRHTRAH